MTLPDFCDSGGRHYMLRFEPPYCFDGVTTRVFPLRARLPVLQSFVDQHLNHIPPELGRFRAFLPFALLMLLDYGRLAQRSSNLGWFSQQEVLFAVPLEWYRVDGDRWVFHDWATISPFIFVDSESSLAMGRTLVGWPKTLCRFEPRVDPWLTDPRAPSRPATVSTMVYPKLYAGARPESRVFLELARQPPLAPFQLSARLPTALSPLTAFAEASRGAFDFGRDVMSLLGNLTNSANGAIHDPDNYVRMVQQVATMLRPSGPDAYVNSINLKQFRAASSPSDYCYQSLTCGRIRTAAVSAGGLLRELGTTPGDLSGGWSVELARWPGLPIVETLGLEVAREWAGPGCAVAELSPVLPFWYEADMAYDRFENVAWRSFDGVWHDGAGKAYPRPKSEPPDLRFNTTLGAASTVAGPFRFADTTMRVLPLLADRAKLQAFVDGYLNDPLHRDVVEPSRARFEVWGPSQATAGVAPRAYVYLVATNFGAVASPSNNVGAWASQELTFLVPVQWWTRDAGGERLRSVGLVPVVTFTDNHTALISNAEVMGIPTRMGRFTRPPDAWMTDASRRGAHPLLVVSSEVLPSVGLGQQIREAPIVELWGGEPFPSAATEKWRTVADTWGPIVSADLERKRADKRARKAEARAARSLALELLADGVPFNLFTMKQFRDVQQPSRACYQSIVVVPRRIDSLDEIREVEEPLHVRIHSFPELPIVDLLGLDATLLPDAPGGGVSHLVQPIRPFWMQLSLTQDLARGLFFRNARDRWHEPDDTRCYFDGDSARPLPVGRSLEDLIDDGAPRGLAALVRAWRERWSDRLTVGEARAAVEAIDPQMVIESILSREWEHHGERARWRTRQRELERGLRERLAATAAADAAREEVAYLRGALEHYKWSRYQPPVLAIVDEKLRLLEVLGEAHARLERARASGDADDTAAALAAVRALLAGTTVGNGPDADRLARLADRLAGATPAAELHALVHAEHQRQRQSVLEKLAKAAQKPDYCARREIAGSERDRMFPLDESWGSEWYVGKA